jgi:hypothetical protein
MMPEGNDAIATPDARYGMRPTGADEPGRIPLSAVSCAGDLIPNRTIKEQIMYGSTPSLVDGVIIAADIRVPGVLIARSVQREPDIDATTDMAIEGLMR